MFLTSFFGRSEFFFSLIKILMWHFHSTCLQNIRNIKTSDKCNIILKKYWKLNSFTSTSQPFWACIIILKIFLRTFKLNKYKNIPIKHSLGKFFSIFSEKRKKLATPCVLVFYSSWVYRKFHEPVYVP